MLRELNHSHSETRPGLKSKRKLYKQLQMNCCFYCLSEQIFVAAMYIEQNILQGVFLSFKVKKHGVL